MSESKNKIKLFEEQQVRAVWDEKNEKWWFSVFDVVAVLTGSDNPRRFWSDLKRKLKAEDSQLYENIVQLKMPSSDDKAYNTDVADTRANFTADSIHSQPKSRTFQNVACQSRQRTH